MTVQSPVSRATAEYKRAGGVEIAVKQGGKGNDDHFLRIQFRVNDQNLVSNFRVADPACIGTP